MDIIQFSDPIRDQLLYSQKNKNFIEENLSVKCNGKYPSSNKIIKSTLQKIFNLLFS
jgi:hypothetical protein